MRARLLKPGFFDDPKLGQLPIGARLLFAGLWCLADREGRLMDIPRRIAAEVFPHDEIEEDVTRWLAELAATGHIIRYEDGGIKCIYIQRFKAHQNVHPGECKSRLPAPPSNLIASSTDCSEVFIKPNENLTTVLPLKFQQVAKAEADTKADTKAAYALRASPPPADDDQGPAVRAIAQMLVDFTKGRLGTPDNKLCLRILNYAGGDPQRVEHWLMEKAKANKRTTMNSWGWFQQVAEAELKQPLPRLLDIARLTSAKAMPQ